MAGRKRGSERSPFTRVYFIGAGLSVGMGYPVGSKLMSKLVFYLEGKLRDDVYRDYVWKEVDGPERAEKIKGVIERVLRRYFATSLSDIERVDVAEFFTVAQALSERSWLPQ